MKEDFPVHPARYRKGIATLLDSIGLSGCEILIVPSIQEWADAHGLEGPGPFTAGMAATRDGAPLVILLDTIAEDIRDGILPALLIRGFGAELERIEGPSAFLEHLVLHEAAHHLLPDSASESECDTWAFARLSGAFHPDLDDGAA